MAKLTFKTLEERVREQLSHEYHDGKDADYEYENMTVPRLLQMLSYIEDEE